MAVEQVQAASDRAAGAHRASRAVAQARRPRYASARQRPSDVADRDHLLDRLTHLRAIVPVFAQELASARRTAAALRVENRRLLERIRELQAQSRHGR